MCKNMTINKNDILIHLDQILRPMGITRNLRSYQLICDCILRIFEQEDRLGAVQKEIYMPIAAAHHCDWTGIQSAIRRAAQTAWHNCPDTVRRMAGYPLDGAPSAVQFLELLYNTIARNHQANPFL